MSSNRDRSVSRRTVISAAAWTTPVIAFAVGAPAASASATNPSTTFSFTSKASNSTFCGTYTMPSDYGQPFSSGQPYFTVNDVGTGWNTGQVTLLLQASNSLNGVTFNAYSDARMLLGADINVSATGTTVYAYGGMMWTVTGLTSRTMTLTSSSGFNVVGGVSNQKIYLPHIKTSNDQTATGSISVTVSLGSITSKTEICYQTIVCLPD